MTKGRKIAAVIQCQNEENGGILQRIKMTIDAKNLIGVTMSRIRNDQNDTGQGTNGITSRLAASCARMIRSEEFLRLSESDLSQMVEMVKARKGQLLAQTTSDHESEQTANKEETSAKEESELTSGEDEFAEFRREAEQVTYTAKVTAMKVLATIDVVRDQEGSVVTQRVDSTAMRNTLQAGGFDSTTIAREMW